MRVTKIINGLGPDLSHSILALNGDFTAQSYIQDGIDVDCISPPPGRGSAWYFSKLRRTIQTANPSLMLTYNWGSIDATLAAWFGLSCPVVHNECGFSAEEATKLIPRRVYARRLILRRAHTTVVTSRKLYEICVDQYKLPAKGVRWIRTGVDTNRFRPGIRSEWRASLGIAPDELVIGFLGRTRPEKNVALLVRAFAAANIPGARLAIIGGPSSCQPDIDILVRELGLGSRVIFAPHAPDPALCLPCLDIFAMSSVTEQTSNALLEAMASGLPAISTDVGDSKELLGGGGHPAVVPSGDLPAYTRALQTLAQSAELRAELGSANRQRCLEKYQLERMIREYGELYYAAAGISAPAQMKGSDASGATRSA